MPKVRRIKKTPIPKLKAKADKVFSLYIRHRDGWTCTICGSKARPQNGHYVKRSIMFVRFNEVNCNCICGPCNYRDNIHHHYYEKAIRLKWGNQAVDEMLRGTSQIVRDLRSLLEDVIRRYG